MRRALITTLTVACLALLGLGMGAGAASASCGFWHVDPLETYTGFVPVGLQCSPWGDPEYIWTVPWDAESVHFSVSGADDPDTGTTGGRVEAVLQLAPGTELTLKVGSAGGASAIRLGEEPLIVAGGGDGSEPNFATPSATAVELEEPGPGAAPWSEGRIDGEWAYWFEGIDLPEESPEERLPDQAEPAPMPEPQAQASACVVPKLRGLKPIAARKVLAASLCAAGEVTRQPARRRLRGRIVRQAPTAGAHLPPGSTIDWVVGKRP